MQRTIITLAAAALVAAAMPSSAQARCHNCGIEAGIAAGAAAGAAAAIAAEALNSNAQAQPGQTPGAPGANYVSESDAATSGFSRRVCRVEESGNRRVEICE